MTDTWHASDDLLVRFATRPEAIDPVTAASVEQHLVGCDRCRQAVADADPIELDALWDEIADRVDQRRRPGVVERVLHLFRLDPGLARLLAATPALRLQGLLATVVVSLGAALLARSAESDGVFLALAPLVVLGLVALSFAPGTDPGGEIDTATPMHGGRLFARRAVGVLGVAGVVLAAASVLVPSTGWTALGWVAPALALALVALALGTRIAAPVAAALLGGGWLVLVQVVYVLGRRAPFSESVLFAPSGQLAALACALAAVTVLYLRRGDLDRGLLPTGPDFGRYL